MGLCHHIWVDQTYYVEECTRCGERRTTGGRYAHQQSGEVVEFPPRTITTTTITGQPVEWPPIQEQESHD